MKTQEHLGVFYKHAHAKNIDFKLNKSLQLSITVLYDLLIIFNIQKTGIPTGLGGKLLFIHSKTSFWHII